MKMTQQHYATLKGMIAPLANKIASHRLFLTNEGKAKDIEKRLRWDLSYAAKATPWICDNLYSYLNDSHIDTALRSIVVELETAAPV